MQADTMAALLEHLDMAPAVIIGGSGGSRISMLAAAATAVAASALAVWWIWRVPFGLMSLAVRCCAGSFEAAWTGGMEAVVELAEWAEVLEAQPGQPRALPRAGPGRVHRDDGSLDGRVLPRRGRGGARHEHGGGPRLRPPDARVPQRRLRHPPHEGDLGRIARRPCRTPAWWNRRGATANGPNGRRSASAGTTDRLFVRWPLLIPQIQEWADGVLVR